MNYMPPRSHPLETVPESEAADIERVIALQIGMMKAGNPKKRGQHPKHQALVRGTFEVGDAVPSNFRAGVFAQPGVFDAAVRISTGPMPKDSDPNPHAFAIKLIDVPGSPSGTQDFILLDQPTFFISNIAEYVQFFESAMQDPGATGFFKAHPRQFGLNLTFNVVIASQLERQYWSEVPIAMGQGAARLTLIPDVGNISGRDAATTDDGLRDALEDHFIQNRRSATFRLAAQAYVDEATTPIEDATSVWPTPFEEIATLTLPPQDFTSPEQYAFGEHLSYTPWHCMPDHQPLGGIQRCRKNLYEASQKLRHELNGVERHEPSKADLERLGRFL